MRDSSRDWELANERVLVALCSILLFAVVIRLLVLVNTDAIPQSGATNYLRLAENLAQGEGYRNMVGRYDLQKPPFFPVLIAFASVVTGDYLTAGYLVSLLMGTLLIVPIFLLTRHVFGSDAGLVAAVIAAVFPAFAHLSTIPMSETTYIFLYTFAAYVGLRALQEGSVRTYVVTGLLFGLAYLTRPQALGYIGVMTALTVVYVVSTNDSSYRRLARTVARRVAPMLGVFFFVVSPYVYYLYRRTGQITFGRKNSANLIKGEATGPFADSPYELERAFNSLVDGSYVIRHEWILRNGPSLPEYILSHPALMIKRYVFNSGLLYTNVLPTVLPFVLTFFMSLGIYKQSWSKTRTLTNLTLVSFILYPLMAFPLFFIRSRHLVPLVAIALPWVGHGVVTVLNSESYKSVCGKLQVPRRSGKLLAVGLVLVLVVPNLFALVPGLIGSASSQPVEQKEAGQWLQQHSEENDSVMDRKTFVAYYADRRNEYFPFENYSTVIEYARYHDVDYMIVSERYTVPNRPQFAFLLDTSNAPEDDLEPVYVDDEPKKIVIYRILDK